MNYAKQLDKQQTTAGYHTPPPTQSTYSNTLINQATGAGGQPYPFMPQQILGQHQSGGAPLIMPGMQDNSRNGAGLSNTKQQQQSNQQQNKSSYQTNSWSS